MRLVYQAWYTVARFGLSVGRFAPSGTRRELYSCTMYDAGKGIRTGYYYDDMVAPERYALIVRLRCKGWPQAQDVRRPGLLQQGASRALQRIAQGRLGRDPRGRTEC
jgi:hypothetical protein